MFKKTRWSGIVGGLVGWIGLLAPVYDKFYKLRFIDVSNMHGVNYFLEVFVIQVHKMYVSVNKNPQDTDVYSLFSVFETDVRCIFALLTKD